jgi:hypothetical protein
MVAASTARRATSRVRAVKTAASNDDESPVDEAKAKSITPKPAKKSTTATKALAKPKVVSAPGSLPAKAAVAKRDSLGAKGSSDKPAPSGRLAERESLGANKKAKPGALVQRVYNTIDGELTKLEKQKGLTSQDRERASRALSQMVNALEKAVEMQRDMTKRKPTGGDAKSKEALAHAEDLRREIAERLERLNRKRAPSRRSE